MSLASQVRAARPTPDDASALRGGLRDAGATLDVVDHATCLTVPARVDAALVRGPARGPRGCGDLRRRGISGRMKLVILGASGGCGRHLVEQAVGRRHEVTAVARASSSLDAPTGARTLRGDLTSVAFLRDAVRGQDAVLSALGLRLPGIAPWQRPVDPDFLDRSTAALLEAMGAEGIRRLVAISAGGVGDSHDAVPAAFRAFIAVSALRSVYPALDRMERALLASALDVCICRPTGLTDEPATGRAVVARAIVGRGAIPRADVAAWMLDEVARPAFAAKTPMITVTGAAGAPPRR